MRNLAYRCCIGVAQAGSGSTTALVERTAQIGWGAKALGGAVPIPDEVNKNFAAVYTYLRSN